jgi:hypothetical protein
MGKNMSIKGFFKVFFTVGCLFAGIPRCFAHPMPNTLVSITVTSNGHFMWIQTPLEDVETAIGNPLHQLPPNAAADYFRQHISLKGNDGTAWELVPDGPGEVFTVADSMARTYQEFSLKFRVNPPPRANHRQFTLWYDAIMHRIVTHQAIVHVRQDWENGIQERAQWLATIQVEPETGQVLPVSVQLGAGSTWTGFSAMMHLGAQHISEGSDHLLFLLLLLLIAPLGSDGRRWLPSRGIRYSLYRLLMVVTAFTIGHSVTLGLCSLGWIPFSTRWIEVLIAGSILVSAIHALRPLFFQREKWVAAGFGLIHGMAFSNTLSGLYLEPRQLMWSILGFNLGIELMQLFLVALVLVPLLVLSASAQYGRVRIPVAILGGVAALAWIHQRLTNSENPISQWADGVVQYPILLFSLLLMATACVYFRPKKMPSVC